MDPRRLSADAQEDLRRRVVSAVRSGMSQVDASVAFGVSSRSVSRWVNAFERGGNRGLVARRRGRRAGEQKALTPRQQARVRAAVLGKFPDQLALPSLVWTRVQVAELIRRWFGVSLSRVSVGKYLRSWGLSPQKPVRVAYERDPEEVQRWLEVDYPAIEVVARKDKAVILWLDQVGLRSDASVGVTWAPVGQTPTVSKTGKRFSVNAMSAISNKGELYFTVFEGNFNAGVFIEFLDRLTRQLKRKVHLIVDAHPSHRAKAARDWLAGRVERIQVHFLPGYAPELNPTELLNGDVKTHVTTTSRPRNKAELARETRKHLLRRQKQPDRVKAFFGKEEVRYAADQK